MNKARTLRVAGGFTLVEVLVTIVVLSFGVLGVAALQIGAMRAAQQAYYRTQAAMLAQQIVAAMRANRAAAVQAGRYATDFGDKPACRANAGLAVCDLAAWKTALRTRLPHGRGRISVGGANVVTVCIRWSQPQRRHSIASNPDVCTQSLNGRRQFELETVL